MKNSKENKYQHEQIAAALHLGEENNAKWAGAVSPPIHNTSTFAYDTFDELREAFLDERENSLYSRGCNPTVRLLEQKIAAIQGTEDALCFGSGSAAIAAAVINCVQSGDHILCVKGAYSWTQKLLTPLLEKWNVSHTYADGTNTAQFLGHIKDNTTLIILESPTSLLFELQDVKAIVKKAKGLGITTLMDNSYGSPLSRYPVECGVDMIAHSATKYIGGHSDVVAGVICGTAERMRSVFYEGYMTLGATLNADAAWLLLRSLRTMHIRISQSSQSAEHVVNYLKQHPQVKCIHWPFSEDHPQHALSKEQFLMPMPMFGFELKKPEAVPSFCDRLKRIKLAVSWGSFESLAVPTQAFHVPEMPPGLIRLYVGLEDPDDLIKDLGQALD